MDVMVVTSKGDVAITSKGRIRTIPSEGVIGVRPDPSGPARPPHLGRATAAVRGGGGGDLDEQTLIKKSEKAS